VLGKDLFLHLRVCNLIKPLPASLRCGSFLRRNGEGWSLRDYGSLELTGQSKAQTGTASRDPNSITSRPHSDLSEAMGSETI